MPTHIYNNRMGKLRQVDLWGSLANQFKLLRESHASQLSQNTSSNLRNNDQC